MSTIPSSLPNLTASPNYSALTNSLNSLSAQTQSAGLDDAPGAAAVADMADDGASDATSASGDVVTSLAAAMQDIARQNRSAALTDSAAALSANSAASALISAQPAAAQSAQANLSAAGVLGLLDS